MPNPPGPIVNPINPHTMPGNSGVSDSHDGLYGETKSIAAHAVYGINGNVIGFLGGMDPQFKQHVGAYGESDQQGVFGHSTSDGGTGVYGNSEGKGVGVRGETRDGIAIKGKSYGTGLAGQFEGDVDVQGNMTANDFKVHGADVAEDFTVTDYDSVSPGFVMTLNEHGEVESCDRAYDKRVAGVISGAGNYRPGLTLDKQTHEQDRMPIALMGKVFCFVDADLGEIEIGDMLTTSPTTGHAMKAHDPSKAFGSVIGKALRPLSHGKALIPILVTLQ